MNGEFHYWRGKSGRAYVHTVFTTLPHWAGAANYVMVRRNGDMTRSPLYIGQTSDFGERWGQHGRSGLIERAAALGANEVHLHLLANAEAERFSVETDIRHGNATPLNEQSVPTSPARSGFGFTSRPMTNAPTGRMSALAQALLDERPMSRPTTGLLGALDQVLLDYPTGGQNALSGRVHPGLLGSLLHDPVQGLLADLPLTRNALRS